MVQKSFEFNASLIKPDTGALAMPPSTSYPQSAPSVSYADGDSTLVDLDEADDKESVLDVMPKSGRGRANDVEMRSLFHQNKHRSLQDIAAEIHGNDRGVHSERSRQVFAMLW